MLCRKVPFLHYLGEPLFSVVIQRENDSSPLPSCSKEHLGEFRCGCVPINYLLESQLLVCTTQRCSEPNCFSGQHSTLACSAAVCRVNISSQTMHLSLPSSIRNTFPVWSEAISAQMAVLFISPGSFLAVACKCSETPFGQSIHILSIWRKRSDRPLVSHCLSISCEQPI
jgi:hypothetical protein